MTCYLSIDIGGTYTKAVIMNRQGDILHRFTKRATVKTDQPSFLNMLEDLITTAEIYTKEELHSIIDGVAFSAPGMIDSQKGIMRTGGSLFCVDNLAISDWMAGKWEYAATIENDARCAALAELWKGSLRGCKTGIVLILGTAVGGGIICDGKILHGANLLAGEFSYLMTNASHYTQRHNLLAEQGGVPALLGIAESINHDGNCQLSGETIFQQALAGHEQYLEAIRTYATRLAVQICNLQVIMDPEKFAIGGGISEQPLLLEMLNEEVVKVNQVYPHRLPLPQITACQFRNDANLIGALYHHLDMAT